MLRTSYMIDIFGRNAPYYRQPKKIITQHFILQNNGDFISKYLFNIIIIIILLIGYKKKFFFK